MERPRTVRDYAALGICIAFALGGIWLFFRYAFGIVVPFLVGWGLAFMVRPLARKVGRGTRIPQHILRLSMVLVAFTLLGVGVYFLGTRLTRELSHLLDDLGTPNAITWPPMLARIFEALSQAGGGEVGAYLTEAVNSLIRSLSASLPALLGKLVSAVPRVVLALAMVLISSVYFCLDLEEVHKGFMRMLPRGARAWVLRAKDGVLRVATTYLRSYLILMGITFGVLLIGFLLMGAEYALLLAFIISLVDLFPVLGVGTVLGPWALWCLLSDNVGRGIALLVLWLVAFFVRQFAEPRLLGGSLGVHPLLTLFAMYAGFSLGGILGMLVFPALCVPLVSFIRRTREQEKKAPESGG